MPPEHPITFGGGISETALHPAVLAAMLIAIALVMMLPRRYVLIPLIFITVLAPCGQGAVFAGVHLYVTRIITIFALLRVIQAKFTSRDRVFANGYTSVDSACVWCILCQAAAVILLFHDVPSLINQAGILIDWLALYIILRFLLRDKQDSFRALRCFAIITVVLAVCMVVEHVKGVNLFSLIGGMRATPELREGKIRAQASFAHPLLAGAFGATLLPLFILLWQGGRAKVVAAMGIIGAAAMTITSNSSTPLLACAAGAAGAMLWPIRRKMRSVRWGIVVALVVLAVVMKAPVWFVIAHIDLTGGSSSYHRAALIDQFIRHFSDWWLLGVKDAGTWGWDMWDAQNQYVSVGDTGGLVALVLFILLISRSFGRLGDARKAIAGDKKQEAYPWLLGAALFAHVVGFFGVNYFDQTRVSWLFLIAVISSLAAQTAPQRGPRDRQPAELSADAALSSTAGVFG